MIKFGVSYIPRPDAPLYRLGTAVVGYDIRARRASDTADLPDALRRVGPLDATWVAEAKPYGFHLTIGDAIDGDAGAISLVERELDGLLRSFAPERPFTLHRRDDGVATWGHQREVVVVRYDPNEVLAMLHALVIARLNPLGRGSGYLTRYLSGANAEMYAGQPARAAQVRTFYSPTVLDNWAPHFTLLNPYTGRDHDGMVRALGEAFDGFSTVTVDTVCLCVQVDDAKPWRIYQEFGRDTSARRIDEGEPDVRT